MTVSSRTPEGLPHACPICGRVAALEPSCLADDAVCPSCGSLLWLLRDRVQRVHPDGLPAFLYLTTPLDELGLDSLEVVELVMELDEAFDLTIPDEQAERARTIGDLLRLLHEQRGGRDDG